MNWAGVGFLLCVSCYCTLLQQGASAPRVETPAQQTPSDPPWWKSDAVELVAEFEKHSAAVYAVAMSPHGKLVASAGKDGVRVWHRDSLEEVWHKKGAVYCVQFLSDHILMYAHATDGVVLCSTADATPLRTFTMPGKRRIDRIVARVSDDGKWLAASFHGTTFHDETRPIAHDFRVWNLSETNPEPRIVRESRAPIITLEFHPETTNHLISLARGKSYRLWDASILPSPLSFWPDNDATGLVAATELATA